MFLPRSLKPGPRSNILPNPLNPSPPFPARTLAAPRRFFNSVAPRLLRPIQRRVGRAPQVVHVTHAVRVSRDPARRREGIRAAAPAPHGGLHRAPDTLGHLEALDERGERHPDRELLTADPRHEIL